MLSGTPLLIAIVGSVVLLVLLSSRWKLPPFLALLLVSALLALVVGIRPANLVATLNTGFGKLMGYIGIVVVLGSIIGSALERSGGATRIAGAMLQRLGRRHPTLAMILIGAITGIPVFCDAGFVILSRLSGQVARQARRSPATLSLGLAGGLYTTHTLVPPTPGPIAAAGNLGMDAQIGYVMLLGAVVALPMVLGIWWLAPRLGRAIDLPFDDHGSADAQLPPLAAALLPLLLPILLIGTGTALQMAGLSGGGWDWLSMICAPLPALALGVAACLPLASAADRGKQLATWSHEGIAAAGPILILTGAGGVFGAVLQAAELEALVRSWIDGGPEPGFWLLLLAFGLAAFLKTAQGSSTSALVIGSAIMASVIAGTDLLRPLFLALLVLALGAGAMTVSHANDSYFWVVSQFSGMTMTQAYRSFTWLTLGMGLIGLLSVLLLHFLFQLGG